MRFSELLLKLASGQQLSSNEMEELRQRAVAVESAEIRVSDMFKEGNYPTLRSPVIYEPDFRGSPMRVFGVFLDTNRSISNNTWTPVEWDGGNGDKSVFSFWQDDETKIRIDQSQTNIRVDGFISWQDNTTNDRVIRINLFNASDVSLATNEISKQPATNSAGFGAIYPFAFTDNLRAFYPTVAYMKIEVFQNSGGSLNVEGGFASISIA